MFGRGFKGTAPDDTANAISTGPRGTIGGRTAVVLVKAVLYHWVTLPAMSYRPNAFGLKDPTGDVSWLSHGLVPIDIDCRLRS